MYFNKVDGGKLTFETLHREVCNNCFPVRVYRHVIPQHLRIEGFVQLNLLNPFFTQGAHYNLIVKLLNDRFGIQARGGVPVRVPMDISSLRLIRQRRTRSIVLFFRKTFVEAWLNQGLDSSINV